MHLCSSTDSRATRGCTDNEGCFASNDFKAYCQSSNVTLQYSSSKHGHADYAEAAIGHLKEAMRALVLRAPFLRVFGSPCVVNVPKEDRGKGSGLAETSICGVIIGLCPHPKILEGKTAQRTTDFCVRTAQTPGHYGTAGRATACPHDEDLFLWELGPLLAQHDASAEASGLRGRHAIQVRAVLAAGHRQGERQPAKEQSLHALAALQSTIAGVLDLELLQGDVETAYLHAKLNEEIYMEAPKGLDGIPKDHVLKLHRGLYGLPASGRGWWLDLDKYLRRGRHDHRGKDTEGHRTHPQRTERQVDDEVLSALMVPDVSWRSPLGRSPQGVGVPESTSPARAPSASSPTVRSRGSPKDSASRP